MADSLSSFVYSREGEKERVDIWVMKEYGALESWTNQFTFDQRVNFIFPLLGFMKNGEVVLKDDDGELVLYDPRVQQVKEIQIRGVQGSLDVLTYYMESLVCLNEGN
ncbi:hypothetical protein L1049_023714 [Liquidambar formosana]|uniref:F-box associated domain-containing protein n=1 Tax=Liquidambar formosana TaxID=63359 RepID=A0AAP0RZZ7_LIQFO